jgi:hypothetical protein
MGKANPSKEASKLIWRQTKWPIIMSKDPSFDNFSNVVMVQESNSTSCHKILEDGNMVHNK